jgi:hypothetical protein
MTTSSHIVISHHDLIVLARHMATEGYDGHEIADMIEKPWNYRDELTQAKADLTGRSL